MILGIDWYWFVVLIYILIIFIIYLIQQRLYFHPEKLPPDFKFKYDTAFEELIYHPEKRVTISALHFFTEFPKGVVLYFHGNTRSIKGWGKMATDFTQYYYEVIMMDYRGFGKSRGKRTEKALFNDAQYVYDETKKRFKEDQIIIYGRSMGSGIAAKLAADNQASKLILEAPYFSFLKQTKRLIPILPIRLILKFHLRTDRWITQVKSPVFIIHGKRDRLITYRSSVKLKNLIPKNCMLLPVKRGKHNNLREFSAYHMYIQKILNNEYKIKDPVHLDNSDLETLIKWES